MSKLKDNDGDVRTGTNKPARAMDGTSAHNQAILRPLDGARTQNELIGQLFGQITNWDHGYLKVRRAADSSDLHLTWTWNIGPASGTYVYTRVMFWELSYGLELLAQKVLEVDEGKRRPTPDKRNPGRTF